MATHVNTAGGAAVEGKIETGTFIGRDQIIVLGGYTAEDLTAALAQLRGLLADPRAQLHADMTQAQLTVTAPGAPAVTLSEQAAKDLLPAAARQADETAHLTALRVNPRYGHWAWQFVALAGVLTPRTLPPGWADIPQGFTALEVRVLGPQRQVRRVPLDDITQAIEAQETLVLLGPPGSGKTTTLERLMLDATHRRLTEGKGPLPLLLPLTEYNRAYSSPYAFLAAKWEQNIGTANLKQRLQQGQLFLLCDGLNEMPSQDGRDYRARVGEWRQFVRTWPGNRMVFTCRSQDDSDLLELPQVEIQPLDDRRIQDFLQRYLVQDLATQAWLRLNNTPLLALVRNPYYLTMLAFVIAQHNQWPANRARLFDGFVESLLRREQQRNPTDWPDANALAQALADLAESMQPLGKGARLPRRDTLARLGPQSETVLRIALAATLLDTESTESIDGKEKQIRFYHHQLQDYWSARALLNRFQAGEDLSQRWRQPMLTREMPNPGWLGDNEPLPLPPATGWEEPTLLAAGLAPQPAAFIETVRAANPVLAAPCLTEIGISDDPAQVTALQQDLLGAIQNRRVHLRARIAAGEALGRLGDPRFQAVQVNGQRILLPPLIHIPGGSFVMGSGFWEVQWLFWQGFFWAKDERPRCRVELPGFFIGQYPVTNAEFACFIAAGGYQEERWWTTAQARCWLRGELSEEAIESFLKFWRFYKASPARLRQRSWSPKVVASWEELVEMDEAKVRQRAVQVYAERPRDQPASWDDEQFNNPSQPVVGVTWYEAQAYCRWLDAQWRAAGVDSPLQKGYTIRCSCLAKCNGRKLLNSPGSNVTHGDTAGRRHALILPKNIFCAPHR